MKRNTLVVIALCMISAMLFSCKSSPVKTSATGSIYEVLVVINNNYWEGEQGDTIKAYMEADMPCLPQMEPYFDLSQVSWAHFDDMLKPVRNILMVEVNPQRYSECKLAYSTDLYSHPQAVAKVTAPSGEMLTAFLSEKGKSIQNYFLLQELQRQAAFYGSFCNHDAEKHLMDKWGVDLKIPSDYQLIKEEDDFIWFCNDNGPKRRDIILYTYPYTTASIFCLDSLTQKRDSIVKRIEGYVEGSYMGTEYNIFPPQFKAISVNDGTYCAEVRGLWRMMGGAAMGGPYVQHTRVDETHQRVVTAEAFVYAAGQSKRNTYRQAEAVLYTLKMPEEINSIKEVTITADKQSE